MMKTKSGAPGVTCQVQAMLHAFRHIPTADDHRASTVRQPMLKPVLMLCA